MNLLGKRDTENFQEIKNSKKKPENSFFAKDNSEKP